MSWLFSRALIESCENLHYLPEPEEEFSGVTCSDGEQLSPLSVMPTQHKFWRQDKTIDHSSLSRFGLTCAVLTESRGEELLMSYLADFPVKTSAPQEKDPDWLDQDQVFGEKWPASFLKFDPASHTWRTAQYSLLEDSESFLGTWPRWGLMLNGESYQQQTPEPTTSEKESGFWPTPVASDTGSRSKPYARGGTALSLAVKLWPTPVKRDYRGVGRSRLERTGSKSGECLPQAVGGLLNPTWVEWLMGWPIGWTELRPLGTGKFQEWQQQHLIYSEED